jgi:hypothetical protein
MVGCIAAARAFENWAIYIETWVVVGGRGWWTALLLVLCGDSCFDSDSDSDGCDDEQH